MHLAWMLGILRWIYFVTPLSILVLINARLVGLDFIGSSFPNLYVINYIWQDLAYSHSCNLLWVFIFITSFSFNHSFALPNIISLPLNNSEDK